MTRAIIFAAAMAAATPALAAEPPASGVEIGLRLGYAFAAGNRGIPPTPPNASDAAVGDFVSGQVPLWLDAGYRFNHELYLGAYFQYGFGVVNDDRQDPCRVDNVDCSASDVRLGVMGRYHLPPLSQLSPWLGLGFGYEWGTFSLHQTIIGATNTDSTWSGFEFANIQLGADYKIAPRVALAPFVSVSIGQYGHRSETTTSGNMSNTTDDDLVRTSTHEWILIGARVAFAP
jgi:opacity protein-like surface antigen